MTQRLISRKPELHEDWIDPFALRIVKSLQGEGFETYLVGGCVRDLLAGIHPKDFDIATSASPQQVKRKVSNSYIIGKRFRLVLVRRGETQYEVATFRRNVTPEELEEIQNSEGPLLGDNYFGTAIEDAKRRDFTINGLFYDPVKHKVIDYVEGLKDIESATLRMIGDPVARFIEDPIRILRAIRLSHKLNFILEPSLKSAIGQTAEHLKKSVLPRKREEYLKFLRLQDPDLAFRELADLQVLSHVLPSLQKIYDSNEKHLIFTSYLNMLEQVGIDKKEPGELFSGLLYAFMKAYFGEDDWNLEQIENDNDFNQILKDELGVFKVEAAIYFKALGLIPQLSNIDNYLRKGERRRVGFLRNEGFDLSLKLAQLDYKLPAELVLFWKKELQKHFLVKPPAAD